MRLSEEVVFEIAYLGMAFFVALALSLLLVWLSRRLAVYMGVMDHPDARKIHKAPIPCLGGVAMAAAMGIALVLCWANPVQQMKAFLLGGAVIAFVGLMDDKFHLSPLFKLLGQILAVSAFMAAGGGTLSSFGDLFGLGELRTGPAATWVTLFCMVGVINAMNLSDGLDGLAGGMGVIAALFYTVLAYHHQAWHWVVISLVLIGVLIGFLRFNQYSAMLFMGDTGSLLIGFSLAAAAVGLAQGGGQADPVRPVTLAVVLGVPVVDTLWVLGRRLVKKHPPFEPDRSHLHHRLLRLGMGHSGVVTTIYGMMLLFGSIAWFGIHWPEWLQFGIALLLCAGIYTGLYAAERRAAGSGRPRTKARPRPGSALRRPSAAIRWFLTSFPFVLILLLIFPSLFVFPLPWIYGFLSISASLFLVLLYPWRTGRKCLLIAHGVMYSACFFLLVIYLFAPHKPPWLVPFLYAVSVLSLIWVIVKILSGRRDPLVYPSGFEVLIISFSWVIPFVVLPMLGIEGDMRQMIIAACALSLPMLYLLKLTVRRDRRRNTWVALCFLTVFLLLTCGAFFRWGEPGRSREAALGATSSSRTTLCLNQPIEPGGRAGPGAHGNRSHP